MCLITIAWEQSDRYPLVIAANRDEFHARPTLPAHQWENAPGVYGGRDLLAGGGWLAVSPPGRLAAVTNVRDARHTATARSRGHLVRDFLLGGASAAAEAARRQTEASQYGPYNLILWDGRQLVYASNCPGAHWVILPPGVHGVSNGPLNAPWPKVRRIVSSLRNWLRQVPAAREPDPTPLLAALADSGIAPDDELPDTGVGLDKERRLSPPFILGQEYGTRASSVVLVARDGQTTLIERDYGLGGVSMGERQLVLPMT